MNIEWFYIRSLIFSKETERGLRLCKDCKHPDAVAINNNDKNSKIVKCLEDFNMYDIIIIFNIDPIFACTLCPSLVSDRLLEQVKNSKEPELLYRFKKFEKAAELGHPYAAVKIMKDHKNFCKYYVIDRLWHHNYIDTQLRSHQIYQIGKYVKEFKHLFKAFNDFDERFILFHQKQNELYRNCVNAWSICAKRLYICKDIRIMIGKMIWEKRVEAEYIK